MRADPDASVIHGARSTYLCRDVADVDYQLRGVLAVLARALPRLRGEQLARVRARFAVDVNALLDARIMLAALATLDTDLAASAAVTV